MFDFSSISRNNWFHVKMKLNHVFLFVYFSRLLFFIFFVESSFNIKGEGGVGGRGIKMLREGGGVQECFKLCLCVCVGGGGGHWGQKGVGVEDLLFSLYH